MDEADYLCERISIIDKGKLVVTDPPKRLKEKVGGTLDDVFIHYTGHRIQDEELNPKAADPYTQMNT
jgi:ABC-2 type transport system ATP-binding protein